MQKVNTSIDQMQQDISGAQGIDAGLIAFACALGYIDFRFPDLDWRTSHPALADWFKAFSERKSLVATAPQG
jgi:glutathione S-transferase